MPVDFTTGVGRIVFGHPKKPQIKKHISGTEKGRPVLRDGKQVEQYVFGVAFPKHEFQQYVLPYLQQEASKAYQHGVPQGFSWKYKDGDSVDRQGKPYSQREGYQGHYVLTISTEAFSPRVFKNEGGRYRELEANEIKCGDYVVVNLSAKVNVPTDPQLTPGLYINPNGIEFVAYGTEIISNGANPDEMFGGRTYQLPPGASTTPVAPSGGAVPPSYAPNSPAPAQQGYPQQPLQQQYVQPTAAYVQPTAAPVQQGYPAPAHDFVQNAMGQPAPQGYPQQPLQQQYAQPTAAPVQQGYPAPGAPATAYPSNAPQQMPGLPQGR